MELYRVTISYRRKVNISKPSEYEWVQRIAHVAVRPGFGGDPIGKAGDLAVEKVVGPAECWDEFFPTVVLVECLGSVHVEEVS
jgi:hypothetical protein